MLSLKITGIAATPKSGKNDTNIVLRLGVYLYDLSRWSQMALTSATLLQITCSEISNMVKLTSSIEAIKDILELVHESKHVRHFCYSSLSFGFFSLLVFIVYLLT